MARRFPGVLLFSEIYQGAYMRRTVATLKGVGGGRTGDADVVAVTGPVARFARQIAGQGYIVAAPSSYHDFTGPEPLAYDVPGTDAGNEYKIKKVRFGSRLPC